MKLSTLILRNFHVDAELDGPAREKLACELELVLPSRRRDDAAAVDAEALVAELRSHARLARGVALEHLALELARLCLRRVECDRVSLILHRRLGATLELTARAELDRYASEADPFEDRYED